MDYKTWSSIRIMLNAKELRKLGLQFGTGTQTRNGPGKISHHSCWKLAANQVRSMQLCRKARLQAINREAKHYSEI